MSITRIHQCVKCKGIQISPGYCKACGGETRSLIVKWYSKYKSGYENKNIIQGYWKILRVEEDE